MSDSAQPDSGRPARAREPLVVGFLYIGPILPLPQIMVASVKAAMPAATVVQMTDADTKPVRGVDKVIRKRWDGKAFMSYRLEHLRDFPPGDTVFLDADVVVRKDISHVFADEFDIGLTLRDASDPSLRRSPEAIEKMPYNTGVMFARASGRDFWREAWERCCAYSESERNWFGDQLAIKETAERTSLKVRTYPCALYNYSPPSFDEDLSERFVVHYKGDERKQWMVARHGDLLRK